MPCLFLLVLLLAPRVVLVLMWLFTDILMRAYTGILIPLLGLIFLPITTIVYALMVNYHMAIAGVNLVILIVAVLLDAGSHGGAYSRRS